MRCQLVCHKAVKMGGEKSQTNKQNFQPVPLMKREYPHLNTLISKLMQ